MPRNKKFPKNGPYANLMTDLIFKKVFNPDNAYTKINLINFLNDILEEQLENPIEDVFSLDKEANASGSHSSRTSIFDLHCRDTRKRTFIVEVQIRQMEFFLKRSFFYASQAIVRQGIPGADYDYSFNPVYVVAISWPNIFDDERYVHHLSLCDSKSLKPNRDFASFTFIELRKFPGIGTGFDALRNWMYLFRYLHTVQKLPAEIQKERYTRLLEMTKVAKLKREELEIYEKEVMSLEWDEYAVRKTRERQDRELREKAIREGREEGLKQGLQKGLQKGVREGLQKGLREGKLRALIEIAKGFRDDGFPLEAIAKRTGLSIKKIKAL